MNRFSRERRPVQPQSVYGACMIGLSIGIPAVIIIPKLIEAHEAGKPLVNTACHYAGSDLPGEWHILEDKGDSYVIVHLKEYHAGPLTVPKSEIIVSERWVPDEYRWFSFFRQ